MNYFWKGITYAYHRNIGWQDRTIRTLVGMTAVLGAVYFGTMQPVYALLCALLAVAQFGTVLSARCIMLYFAGQCSIGTKERKALEEKGIPIEKRNNNRSGAMLFALLFLSTLNGYGQSPEKHISADFPYKSQFLEVNGIKMHYIEQGTGDPVLFLHGIPTSLYLWRNVIPEVSGVSRAIAVDLAGFGQSDIPAGQPYSANNQYNYLEAFIDKLGLQHITLVVNDLGSVYGLKYAADHPEKIKGIVVAEGVVMPAYDWYKQLTFMQKSMFWMFRNDHIGRSMLVKHPRIQKMIVPMMTKRKITKTEKEVYLAPYKTDKLKRMVVYAGPGPAHFPKKKTLNSGGNNNEFVEMMNDNAVKLKGTTLPVLILFGHPGFILNKPSRKYAQQNFPRLTLRDVGKGKHFLPEDHPHAMGQYINNWIKTL